MTAAAQPTVVVTYPGFDPQDQKTAGALKAAGFEIRLEPRYSDRSPADTLRIMVGATAGIVSTDPFTADVLAGCPRLRVLARVGVGIDTIDVAAATAAGVAVTITPDTNTAAVADHTIALILACCRRVLENDATVRTKEWSRGGPLTGRELTGATVGIIGLGMIGRAVAERLAGFGVRLLGTDLPGVRYAGCERVALGALLGQSDIVSLHVPLSRHTQGMIGERELAMMRRGAIFINTARGGVVDETALVRVLSSGHLAGAGLDVFAQEPPLTSPLLRMPNVVLSPHIAGISISSQQSMLEMAADSILDILAGRDCPRVVNPEAIANGRAKDKRTGGVRA
ncbi:MAG: phosphoglycerate dehydrogenase [Solirubrobacterales bacterium]|nr:phosphoglycerate dehydrogenase [Solirubrobacterales bacterium]